MSPTRHLPYYRVLINPRASFELLECGRSLETCASFLTMWRAARDCVLRWSYRGPSAMKCLAKPWDSQDKAGQDKARQDKAKQHTASPCLALRCLVLPCFAVPCLALPSMVRSTLLGVGSLRFERLQPMGRIWREPVYNNTVVSAVLWQISMSY